MSTSRTETNSTIVSKFLWAQITSAGQHLLIPVQRRNGSGASAVQFADSLEEEGQVLVDDPADDDERRDETDSDLRSARAFNFRGNSPTRDATLQDAPGWRSR